MTQDGFLAKVYDLSGADRVEAYYDAWSDSYDAELTEHGYATPARCATALQATETPGDALILDFGCGTGVSGYAFSQAGFTRMHGCDLSRAMLAKAAEKQIYEHLWQSEPGVAPDGSYDVIAAVGVISPGAASPETLGLLLSALKPGGRMVMSFNDHALEDPDYVGALEAALAQGVRILHEEYGPHISRIGLNSRVYVLET